VAASENGRHHHVHDVVLANDTAADLVGDGPVRDLQAV